MGMLEEYPTKITLPDGATLTLRPMTRDDQYALYSFFISLTEDDRRFLRNDVTDRKLIENWARNLDYEKVLPILAESEGKIVGNATLHYQTFGWGRHVAELRITIAPEFQGRKLGSLLLEEIAKLAAKSHVKKLLARVVTAREPLIRAFTKAGFSQVAVLQGFVQDVYQKNLADIALLVKELTPGE
jgi:L-amino acid N-acyltransferase YncA